jgi:hypothetical protein
MQLNVYICTALAAWLLSFLVVGGIWSSPKGSNRTFGLAAAMQFILLVASPVIFFACVAWHLADLACRPFRGRALSVAAALLIAAPAFANPSTRPASDRLIYHRADGRQIELRPADDRWPIVNRDVAGAEIVRPDGGRGVWVVAPAAPSDGPLLPPGSDITAAIDAAAAGTRIYLQAGATYPAAVIRKPVTLLAWGEGPRPRIIAGGDFSALYAWAVDGITLRGVACVGTGEQARGAALELWGCRDFLAEDCEFSLHRYGVSIQPARERRPARLTFARCWIRDNCAPPGTNTDCHGLFAGAADALQLSDCLIDRNGWSDRHGGSARNHGVYVRGDCGPAIVSGCLIARSASHGLQARSGGDVLRNVFVDNPIHLSYGLVNGEGPIFRGGVSGDVAGNAFIGSRLLAGQVRGWAIEVGNNVRAAQVRGNLFHLPALPGSLPRGLIVAAVKVDVGRLADGNPDRGREVGVVDLSIVDNAATWPVASLWIHPDLARQVRTRGRINRQAEFPAASGDAVKSAQDAAEKIRRSFEG